MKTKVISKDSPIKGCVMLSLTDLFRNSYSEPVPVPALSLSELVCPASDPHRHHMLVRKGTWTGAVAPSVKQSDILQVYQSEPRREKISTSRLPVEGTCC